MRTMPSFPLLTQAGRTSRRDMHMYVAGEARTKAMAEAAGAADDEDFAFDSFADPGGLIMSSIIEKHLQGAPNKQHLLDRAQALKLPGNPLVSCLTRPLPQLASPQCSLLQGLSC